MNDQLGLAMLGAEWKSTAFEDFFKMIYKYRLYMCKGINKDSSKEILSSKGTEEFPFSQKI